MPITMLSDKEMEELNNDMIEWLRKIFKTQYGTNVFNMLMSMRHLIENLEYEMKLAMKQKTRN